MSRVAAGAYAALTAGSLFAFAHVTARVHRRQWDARDERVGRALWPRVNGELRRAAKLSGPLGKWYALVPASAALGWLSASSGRRGASVVFASSVTAAALSRCLDRLLPRRAPPPGREEPWEQSYPSGHALETTTLALVSGHVLVRQRVVKAWVLAPLALAALASGAGRFALERHRFSDLLGGYLAGIALGACCSAGYELQRD